MGMEELVAEINRALRQRGLSAREASMRAVGSPELVRDMRRGYVTSVAKFQALCEVLDLEFYVGPRREEVPVDERRLGLAVEAAERGLEGSGQALGYGQKARLLVEVYQLIGRDGGAGNAARLRRLIGTAGGGAGAETGEEAK